MTNVASRLRTLAGSTPPRSVNPPLTKHVPSSLSFLRYASDPSLQSLNKKITSLVRTGRVDEARAEFDRAEHRNSVTWNAMLSGYVKRREIAKARKLFDGMPQRDVVSWNLMISAYMSCHVEEARKLFDEMPQRDSCSWNTVISGYAKNGEMSEALRLFNRAPERNSVSWNAVITGFLLNGDAASAVRLFEAVPWRARRDTLCVLVSGLVRAGRLDEAARVFFTRGDKADRAGDLVWAYNALIAGYGRRGRAREARRLFDTVPFRKNLVTWNSMMMCYLRANDVASAREIFDRMTTRDSFSWNTMITGYVHVSDMDEAYGLFKQMPSPDTLTWNLMVSGFSQIGKPGFARGLFDSMPKKNLVSWNSMVAGYEKNEDYKGSIGLFARMRIEGVEHDCHTLSSVLSACTGLVDLSLGRQVHQLAVKTLVPDVVTRNSFITMYSRCGAIREARAVFDETGLKKDVISWNAMIGGYAAHGLSLEALELFETMRVKPTGVTFVAVLNACANAGLVEEGQRQFESMRRDFGIEPGIEHYASLVGIVGRGGRLDEAADVIGSMPMEPDESVWGALLGACRAHGDVRLARVAAEALVRLEPESSAPYVSMYNLYADLGLWDEAAKVRLVMEDKNVIKERGCSRLGGS